MTTTVDVFQEIKQHADSIANDGEHHPNMEPGDAWYQGDIALLRLSGVPNGITPLPDPALQLVPGATQGSRHCLRSLDGITLYTLTDATPLDGPVIKADRAFWVDHPEHGNVELPAGIYGVFFQRARADELRRIQD